MTMMLIAMILATKNITGSKSAVRTFKKGKFEYVSNQLPPGRNFAIKR